MTDLRVLLEALLLISLPFSLVIAGVILRRKFRDSPSKAGRVLGTAVLCAGILAVLFCVLVVLNFKGIL
ncbi:MAG: hypothetical protein NTX64_04195 [Elusimicrobia bacterium]|nr:hypothetical protein [Elusimicrobiota bacterium]